MMLEVSPGQVDKCLFLIYLRYLDRLGFNINSR